MIDPAPTVKVTGIVVELLFESVTVMVPLYVDAARVLRTVLLTVIGTSLLVLFSRHDALAAPFTSSQLPPLLVDAVMVQASDDAELSTSTLVLDGDETLEPATAEKVRVPGFVDSVPLEPEVTFRVT